MWRTDAARTDTRPLKTTSVTDPATNAATSITILDTFSGVIITTTTTGNAQTLQTPTVATDIKRFSVINNDTSTDDVTVNGTVMSPWDVKYFVWDWSSWTTEAGWTVSSIVWITGTKAEFNTAVTDGDIVFVWDAINQNVAEIRSFI